MNIVYTSPGTVATQNNGSALANADTINFNYNLVATSDGYTTVTVNAVRTNIVTVATSDGEFSSIVSALASITTASASNPYMISIAPGVYTESQIQMKAFVYIHGSGEQATVIQPSNASQNFILMVENSSIRQCLITGVTGSGFAAIYMSSSTGTDQTPCFVEDCKLGNNDTHAICSPVNANNAIFFNNCEIGGTFQFNNGFKATTTGTGIGRIILKDSTTTSMTAPLPNYVASATGTNCEILVDGCSFRTGATSTGSCIQVDSGGLLRIIAMNAKGFGKALWMQNVGAASTLYADGITLENNTQDIQIDHASSIANVIGSATLSKITNSSSVLGHFIIDQPTGVSSVRGLRTKQDNNATANTTTTMASGAAMVQRFTGSTSGQIMKLPDATTLSTGHRFEFWNDSTVLITIQDNGATVLLSLAPSQQALFILDDNSTAAGIWSFTYTDYTPSLNIANSTNAFDDFLAGTANVSTLGTLRWTIFNTGTGAATTQPSTNTDNAHIGVGNLAVAAVSSISSLAIADVDVGGGQYIVEGLVRIGALGSGTQNYVMQFGFGTNEQATTDPTDGIFFEYSQASSTQWRCRTTRASTSTNTLSGVTVTANSWYKLRFILNPAASSVQFFISAAGGGAVSSVATTTTNIPLTTTDIRPFFKIRKTVGTGAVSFDVDYFQMQVNLTNTR